MSLQHSLHGLITHCALHIEDRMFVMNTPRCCRVRPSKAGGYWLLRLILCEGSHVLSPTFAAAALPHALPLSRERRALGSSRNVRAAALIEIEILNGLQARMNLAAFEFEGNDRLAFSESVCPLERHV